MSKPRWVNRHGDRLPSTVTREGLDTWTLLRPGFRHLAAEYDRWMEGGHALLVAFVADRALTGSEPSVAELGAHTLAEGVAFGPMSELGREHIDGEVPSVWTDAPLHIFVGDSDGPLGAEPHVHMSWNVLACAVISDDGNRTVTLATHQGACWMTLDGEEPASTTLFPHPGLARALMATFDGKTNPDDVGDVVRDALLGE